MATADQHIIQLLEKYSRKQVSAAEIDQLLSLLREGKYDESVVSFIENNLETFEPDSADDMAFWKNKLAGGAQKITSGAVEAQKNTGADVADNDTPVIDMPVYTPPVHRVHFMRKWGWVAASVLLLLGIGAYLWMADAKKTAAPAAMVHAGTIAPGKNGAVLTLADGSQVVLDSLGNGTVATQNGTQVLLQGGGLAYDASGAGTGEVAYNTMTTPKGRQFQVTLPDGTKVWLNAASSLRYPTVFTGDERRVKVTGEAYFEVAHNSKMPFKVDVNGQAAVEVLGTHFNINAYDNEVAIHTTLLEGSVRVAYATINNASLAPAAVTLKPGQQAQIVHGAASSNGGGSQKIKVINSVDINKIMAWKNGLFNFEGVSLGEIMRQVERWYDIEVTYEKGIPNVEFEGKMTRDVPLHDLLIMLERSDIHFRMEDRKLIVLP